MRWCKLAEKLKKCMRMRQTSDDDIWWFEEWLGKIPAREGKLCDEEIFRYLSELKKIYDNRWYRRFRKSKPGLGPCPLTMIGDLQSIIRFAQNLTTLGGVEKLEDELIERLSQWDTFLDASLEVEVGACFTEAGYETELYPSTSKGQKCDMRVRGEDYWVYVEVTRLGISKKENIGFKLSGKLIDEVFTILPENICGTIKLISPSQLQPERIVELIIQKISEEYSKNGLPVAFKNENVEVNLREKQKNDFRGVGVEGLSFLSCFQPKEEGRHLVEQALYEYSQLPPGGPGVIIVNPLWLLAPEIDEGIMERLRGLLNSKLHTRVSGIVITNKIAERSNIKIKTLPFVVINANAKRRCDKDIERLAQALFIYPSWL